MTDGERLPLLVDRRGLPLPFPNQWSLFIRRRMSDGAVMAKAWWFGMNPFFQDKSPVEVLLSAKDGDITTLMRVVRAARTTATS